MIQLYFEEKDFCARMQKAVSRQFLLTMRFRNEI